MQQGTSTDNPHLLWVRRNIRDFRSGRLSVNGLERNLSGEVSAMEGDIAQPVKQALEGLLLDLDYIYWTAPDDREEIDRAIKEAEAVLDDYYPCGSAPVTP